jgi:hypothetical protein
MIEINKYEVKIKTRFIIKNLENVSRILSFQIINKKPYVWIIEDILTTTFSSNKFGQIYLFLFGLNEEEDMQFINLNENNYKYLGSFKHNKKYLHLFEDLSVDYNYNYEDKL